MARKMQIGGIDPGKTGATVVIDTVAKTICQYRFKFGKDDNDLDMGGWFNFITKANPSILFVERVAGHSKSGGKKGKWSPSTLFKLGDSFGQIRAAATMSGKPIRFVSPSKWQRRIHVGINAETAKDRSTIAYGNMYPHFPIPNRAGCNPNHNVVDALLIATFGLLELGNDKIEQWEYIEVTN